MENIRTAYSGYKVPMRLISKPKICCKGSHLQINLNNVKMRKDFWTH